MGNGKKTVKYAKTETLFSLPSLSFFFFFFRPPPRNGTTVLPDTTKPLREIKSREGKEKRVTRLLWPSTKKRKKERKKRGHFSLENIRSPLETSVFELILVVTLPITAVSQFWKWFLNGRHEKNSHFSQSYYLTKHLVRNFVPWSILSLWKIDFRTIRGRNLSKDLSRFFSSSNRSNRRETFQIV